MDCYKKIMLLLFCCISDSLIMTRGCLPTALDNDCQRSSAGGGSTVMCYCNSDPIGANENIAWRLSVNVFYGSVN